MLTRVSFKTLNLDWLLAFQGFFFNSFTLKNLIFESITHDGKQTYEIHYNDI
jgi:hypothetical protein